MHALLIPSIEIIIGLLLLVWSADRFVIGAAALARHLGISPLVIGLTIVGFGTSAPEMLVSLIASLQGNPGIAIGNALGSNITNIALVLGCTALILPLTVDSGIIRNELPILIIVCLVTTLLMVDGNLGRVDGLIMLCGIFFVMGYIIKKAMQQHQDVLHQEIAEKLPQDTSLSKAVFCLVIGLLILLLSAKLLVEGAITIAHYFNVDELIIGLTIVAIGTSLPELAASIVAAVKKQDEIAVGNVIGSNIFNLLVVLGLPAVITPMSLPEGVLSRDLPVMLILTAFLFLAAFHTGKRAGRITRLKGSLFLLAFVAYEVMLYLSTVQ